MKFTARPLALLLPIALLAGCHTAPMVNSSARALDAQAMAAEAWIAPEEVSTENDPAIPADAADAAKSDNPADPGILRFAEVEKNKLYRGGLPSKADLKKLVDMGIKTDIDLMGEIPGYDTFMVERERRWAKEVGLKFIQVKVPTNRIPLFPKIANKHADAFLKAACDPANQPVYFHCLHGRDRTGTMASVYRIAKNGWSNEQAFAEQLSFGFSEKDYPGLAAFVKQYKAQ